MTYDRIRFIRRLTREQFLRLLRKSSVPNANSADRLMPDALYDDLREYLEGQVDVDGQGGPNKASRFLDRLEAECRKQKGGSMIDRSDERLNPNDYR